MADKIKVDVKTEVIKDPKATVVEIPMKVWKAMKEQARKEVEHELEQSNIHGNTSDSDPNITTN